MPPNLRLPLVALPLVVAAGPAAARLCDEDDLAVIEELLFGEWNGGTEPVAVELLDESWLAEVAAAVGCTWERTPGGPAEALERLRFRDAPLSAESDAADPWARFRPWWRVLLPRIELRWWSGTQHGTTGERAVESRSEAVELWLLWSVAGGP